jgi:hypothetical protein
LRYVVSRFVFIIVLVHYFSHPEVCIKCLKFKSVNLILKWSLSKFCCNVIWVNIILFKIIPYRCPFDARLFDDVYDRIVLTNENNRFTGDRDTKYYTATVVSSMEFNFIVARLLFLFVSYYASNNSQIYKHT